MRVFVYYNLHKKLWSVKALEGPQKGRVIARSWYVSLTDVMPRVSQAGRKRVLREKRKNVHAGLVGTLCESSLPRQKTESKQVSYNPYKCGNFYHRQEPEKEYTGSDYAQLVINLDNKPAVFTRATSEGNSMKDYSVNWDPSGVYPEITRDYLGILPEFFIHATQEGDTLEQVTQAMDSVYGYGGFQYPFGGTVAESGVYRSPDDPDLKPYATISYLDRFTMYCYPYAITAIRDNDTGETRIGRFD